MRPESQILIDGYSYLYRAFHALPPMFTSGGQPVGAIKGVVNMIIKLRREYPNNNFVFVMDCEGDTFRHELYPEYKANRDGMPEDLKPQIEPLVEVIRAMGIPVVSYEGYEADDVIGTIAKKLSAKGRSVVISTGDKDIAQLVDDNIVVVNTMTGESLNQEKVIDKFGVEPHHIIDYLALMGDKSDNIPGVMNIGPKSAVALINGLGMLEDIYDNLDKVAELGFRGAKGTAKKLEDDKENAFLSKILTTIRTDLTLGITSNQLKNTPPDTFRLNQLYERLELKFR